jgi:hypothetical protein
MSNYTYISKLHNIKMDHEKIRYEGVHWIHLVHNVVQCQVLVNMIMTLQVHKMWEISRPTLTFLTRILLNTDRDTVQCS